MHRFSFIQLTLLFSILTGCATIGSGTKHKINIKSNLPDPEITVNSAPATLVKTADGLTVIIPKKYRQPTLGVSYKGYETQSIKLVTSKSVGTTMLNALGLGFGLPIFGSGFMFSAGVFDKREYGYVNGQPRTTVTSRSEWGIPFYLVGGAMTLFPIIDGVTKANTHIAHKELFFDLIKEPEKANRDETEVLNCTSVKLKVSTGQEIGKVYGSSGKKFREQKTIKWEESANIKLDELTVDVNTILDQYGYPVAGFKSEFRTISENERFQISATIQDFTYNQYVNSNYRATGSNPAQNLIYYTSDVDENCSIRVNWAVYDNRRDKVVLELVTGASVWGTNAEVKGMFLRALNASLKRLMIDETWMKTVVKKQGEVVLNKFSPIGIAKSGAGDQLTEFVEAAVTVISGDGHGSGFIISQDGYVLTNYHVVGDNQKVSVVLSNGLKMQAEVVRKDDDTDVALLKLGGEGFKRVAINLTEAKIGSDVIAVGTPGSKELGQSVTKGVVSGKRTLNDHVYIQTDVSISPGHSGGPLFNERKEVIGIINSKMIGKGVEGVGFAIPIAIALEKLGIELQ